MRDTIPTGRPGKAFLAWLLAQAVNAEASGNTGLARVWWDTLDSLSPEQPEEPEPGSGLPIDNGE